MHRLHPIFLQRETCSDDCKNSKDEQVPQPHAMTALRGWKTWLALVLEDNLSSCLQREIEMLRVVIDRYAILLQNQQWPAPWKHATRGKMPIGDILSASATSDISRSSDSA